MTEEIDRNILRRYEIQHRIGRGAYGVVWEASNKKSGNRVALKKIFDAFQNNTDAQRTFREIMLLQEFHHPNIIKLLNVYRALNDRDIYLTFEYMETDLHSAIRANILEPIHKKYIIYQILCSVKYLHSAELIHRDLKPSNILLNSDCLVKICDFGLSRSFGNNSKNNKEQQILTDYVATRWYRAPEILCGSNEYTESVDLWALGCILGEMISKKPLFPGHSTMDQIDQIIKFTGYPTEKEIQSIKSPFCQTMLGNINKCKPCRLEDKFNNIQDRKIIELLDRLLQFNPDKRLNCIKCLEHPYLKDFHCEEDEPSSKNIIRVPIDDNKQLTVSDYRKALYRDIHKRNKRKKEKRRKKHQSNKSSRYQNRGY